MSFSRFLLRCPLRHRWIETWKPTRRQLFRAVIATKHDLYFEYLATSSHQHRRIDRQKRHAEGVSLGVGVRVISGERTGYAYSDDLRSRKNPPRCPSRCADRRRTRQSRSNPFGGGPQAQPLSSPDRAPMIKAFKERVATQQQRADISASAYDPRIISGCPVTYADSLRHEVMVATSDGVLEFSIASPSLRLNVLALAREGDGVPQQGHSGGGGRHELEFFLNDRTPEYFMAGEAARQAIVQLDAVEAPAGEQVVVLGPGWPGVLLHEAVGHGLEADFNRKGVSAFTGRIGQQVASPLCCGVVDDDALSADAAAPSTSMTKAIGKPRRNVLIRERGYCAGSAQDKLSASRITKAEATGNGRRES